MTQKREGKKVYDLEERTLRFSKRIVQLGRALPENCINEGIIKHVVSSGTSVGANYREANDPLGDKDFLYRLRISRKEAKETEYWLMRIMEHNPDLAPRMEDLHDECTQILKILSKIIIHAEKKQHSVKEGAAK